MPGPLRLDGGACGGGFSPGELLPAAFTGLNQNVGIAALQARLSLHGAMGARSPAKRMSSFLAEIGVRDFRARRNWTTASLDCLRQEADGVVHLEVVVMIVGVGTEL